MPLLCPASALPARRRSAPRGGRPLTAHDLTGAGVERLTGRAVSSVRSKEDIARPISSGSGGRRETSLHRTARHGRPGKKPGSEASRPDPAHRVDPDLALLEMLGERARDRDDRAFGRGVVDQVRAAATVGDRVDDLSAEAPMGERGRMVRRLRPATWRTCRLVLRAGHPPTPCDRPEMTAATRSGSRAPSRHAAGAHAVVAGATVAVLPLLWRPCSFPVTNADGGTPPWR